MNRLTLCGLLIATRVGIAAEADLPCENIDDPAGLSTLCGFAKPEDLQFVRSRSIVVVSEQGWKAPASGGSWSSTLVTRAMSVVSAIFSGATERSTYAQARAR